MAGAKMKTKRSAAKRLKITGSVKAKFMHAFRRHLLTKKSRNRKRALRKDGWIDPADAHRITMLCPYG